MIGIEAHDDFNREVLLSRFWTVAMAIPRFIENPPKDRDQLWQSFLSSIREAQVNESIRRLFELRISGKEIKFWSSSLGIGLITADGLMYAFIPSRLLSKTRHIPELKRAADRGRISKTGRITLVDAQTLTSTQIA